MAWPIPTLEDAKITATNWRSEVFRPVADRGVPYGVEFILRWIVIPASLSFPRVAWYWSHALAPLLPDLLRLGEVEPRLKNKARNMAAEVALACAKTSAMTGRIEEAETWFDRTEDLVENAGQYVRYLFAQSKALRLFRSGLADAALAVLEQAPGPDDLIGSWAELARAESLYNQALSLAGGLHVPYKQIAVLAREAARASPLFDFEGEPFAYGQAAAACAIDLYAQAEAHLEPEPRKRASRLLQMGLSSDGDFTSLASGRRMFAAGTDLIDSGLEISDRTLVKEGVNILAEAIPDLLRAGWAHQAAEAMAAVQKARELVPCDGEVARIVEAVRSCPTDAPPLLEIAEVLKSGTGKHPKIETKLSDIAREMQNVPKVLERHLRRSFSP